jgi:hypothetical protein
MLAGVTVAALTAWSFDSQAQLQPPPPMPGPPPGAFPAQPPIWGFPVQQQPMAPMAPPNTTAQQLDAGDASGSFRGLEVAWVNLSAGGGYASLPSKLDYTTKGAGGPAFDLGVGGRFITWTLGVRARVMPTSSFTLVQGLLEAGYHLPMGAWDPYVDIRGGYVTALMKQETVGSLLPSAGGSLQTVSSSSTIALPNAHGVDLGLSVGDDLYLSALFSVGLDVSFDTMFLSHGTLSIADNVAFASASGIGFVVVGSLHAGLHFDL